MKSLTALLIGTTFVLLASMSPEAFGARGGDGSAVGNGGGFPETQAVYFHQQLGAVLSACSSSENLCGLTSEDRQTLALVAKAHAQETAEVKLTFAAVLPTSSSSSSPADFIFETARTWGSEIKIATRALYNEDGSPKATPEIASVIFAARWLHANPKFNSTELLIKARLLMHALKFDLNSVPAEQSATTQILHDQTLGFNGSHRHAIFLEDETETYDITPLVQASLPCGRLEDATLTNLRGSAYPGVTQFVSQLLLTCSHERLFMQIEIPTDRMGRLDSAKAAISVRSDFN